MTAFVRRHNLKRTHPYLDDVIIGGRSVEVHQENLKNFLKAAEIEGLTLNKAKCVFGCKTVPMLGHIVGAGSKRPDPSRIKTLMDFLIPENSSQLKRLLGFFAYNAKWIADLARSSSHWNSKTSAAKMELRPPKLPPSGQWPKRALQRNCVESCSVPATLHKPPTNRLGKCPTISALVDSETYQHRHQGEPS